MFIGNSPNESNYMPSMSAPKEFVIICHSNLLTDDDDLMNFAKETGCTH